MPKYVPKELVKKAKEVNLLTYFMNYNPSELVTQVPPMPSQQRVRTPRSKAASTMDSISARRARAPRMLWIFCASSNFNMGCFLQITVCVPE